MDDKLFPVAISLLTGLVLAIMLRAPEERYYAAQIADHLGENKDRSFSYGTKGGVDSTLRRLARVGWLTRVPDETDPAVTGRPRRAYYKLSEQGLSEGRRYVDMIRSLLR